MKEAGLEVGKGLNGFEVNRVVCLPDLRATLYRLTHEGTGAELIHFANEDDNNLFSVAFRTTPKDSTGVAHILEHTVLCGSERFPVRDPFFSMLKRSLNTFMNAFTANDWTMYPFSTQNEKDFYNLMDIYLDAAFFPRIDKLSFQQEGWRLELADPSDAQSDLIYKGVVYNEMKGAMSDPSSLMNRRIQNALYPTTTYHYNSGGEPSDIPDLTWQQLRDFHARYYHPSNSRFFTYGNLPLARHLKVINERVLSRFERIEADTSAGEEVRFAEPKREEFSYPLDPSSTGEDINGRSFVSVAWLTCSATDPFEVFTLKVLSSLLLGNAAAPLYKALMDSGLGSSLAPGTGYDDEKRETSFAAGLQGVRYEDAGKVEDLVLSTLEKIAEEGFSEERVEAVIHQLEFSNKEVVGNHFPYALSILFRMFGSWVHDGDPVQPLLINEHLERLRSEMAGGAFFENKIREHLLDNNHRVTVVLRPDTELGAKEAKEEAERLARIKNGLSPDDVERIIGDSEALKGLQESEEDIGCLPTLELRDIPPESPKVDRLFKKEEGVDTYWFDQPTNGISYFNAIVSTESVPDDLKPFVPLFCGILTKIGAAGFDYTAMAERIEACTGGISAGANVWEDLYDVDSYREVVEISAKSLVRNHGKMFGILSDIVSAPDFRDLKRLHTLIGQIKTSMENSVPGSGHSYARGLAARHLTPAARLRESWFGIHQLQLVKELASRGESELGEFAERMEEIASHLLNRAGMKACVVTEERYFDSVRDEMTPFVRDIPEGGACSRHPVNFAAGTGSEGWSTNVPVSYVAHVFRAVPYAHEDSPKLQVLAKLLRSCYLHREIREKGGAYGGYAAYSGTEGIFSFLSYRDPHLERTLNVYRDSIDWVIKGGFSDEDMKEAILSTFSGIDRPLSPAGKGNSEFVATLRGLTREMRQKRREAILALKREEIVDAARRHLKEGAGNNSVAVISSGERLNKANEALKDNRLQLYKI